MGHFGLETSFSMGELDMQPYTPVVVDLGEQNEGQFGPTEEVEADYDNFVDDMTKPEYRRKPSGTWVCVDGREDVEGSSDDGEHADGQTPGSLPITNTAGDMMDDTQEDLLLSQRVAANTQDAVAANHGVVVHGDDHNGKEGCAAIAKMRVTLKKIAENADIIGPRVWVFCEATGLSRLVTPDDITKAMVTAGERADDDSVWDATPSQVIDIAVANGARYQTLKGPHRERVVAAPLKGTYASQKFAKDHTTADGERHEVFGLSPGEYVATTIADAVAQGGTERDGALKAMRGLTYSTGLCKKIGNENLRVVALKTP